MYIICIKYIYKIAAINYALFSIRQSSLHFTYLENEI